MPTLNRNQRPSASAITSVASSVWLRVWGHVLHTKEEALQGVYCQEAAAFLHSPDPKLNLSEPSKRKPG